MFDRYDLDKSGNIDANELLTGIIAIYHTIPVIKAGHH